MFCSLLHVISFAGVVVYYMLFLHNPLKLHALIYGLTWGEGIVASI